MTNIAWWPTIIVMVIASVIDLRTQRIPNWLVVPYLVIGLVFSGLQGGLSSLGNSFLGMGLAVLVMGVLYFLGGTGMGDVKLCSAAGIWLGPAQMGFALVMMALAGGLLALAWAAHKGVLAQSLDGAGTLVGSLAKNGLQPHPELALKRVGAHSMPYAPAIAIGTIFSFFVLG